MGIPATLSSVPATTPYIQYVATSGQTVFPYPFVITQDSDLVVVDNGVTYDTDAGYTVSGVGNPTGGNVTLNTGAAAGDIITLYRDIPIERLTQFAQNGGFSSTAFNAEFNNVYLLLQQLQTSIDQCLQIPNTNNPAPTVSLTPGAYANKYLAFDSNGNPTPAQLTTSGAVTQALIAGLLTPQTSVESSVGVTPAYLQYEPGDTRRYSTLSDWALVLGSYKGRFVGTYSSSTAIAIPSGADVEWAAGSVFEYTGTGAAITLSSVKDVTLTRPYVDISGAGTAAIAIQINGGWMIDINQPKVKGYATANTQVGIQINTSASAGADFGAYCIRIVNPNLCAITSGGGLKYGIQTVQTASDTVSVTHLQILGGWINSGSTAGILLQHVSSWRVEGTTLENVADGLQYSNCDNGFISLGEVDASGYAVNPLDAASSRISLVAPSVAGSYTSGYVNTTNSTPDYIGYGGELRMYPNGLTSSKYFVSYKAQYSATAALVEEVSAGGTAVTLRNVDSTLSGTGVQELQAVAGISGSNTAAKNLRGSATFSAGTSVAVTFANAEADNTYYIALGAVGNPGGYLWISSPTTTGFTINCSASTSITVNWVLVR